MLQVDYIDMVLIHWPGASRLAHDDPRNAEKRQGSWEDLEELYNEGIVKSIGVSNYTIRHLEQMINEQNGYAKIKPVVNQVPFPIEWAA